MLERVRARDEAAARELVELLHPMIAPVVQRNLPRREAPEDLLQDIYLRIFSRLGQFRGEMPFLHWARRIALNVCVDRLRRQKVRPELRWADLTEDEEAVLENTAGEVEPAVASDADASTARGLAERLLGSLSADDAWLLRQLELEGRSIAEVCAETGWNSGVTRVRAFRARRRLQAAFRRLEASR